LTVTNEAKRNEDTVEPLVRLTLASRLLAGLLSNPVVVAHNANCGWCLVNASDADIAGYAFKLADELIAAQAAMPNKAI
jgi:hypothetical protein